jgi:hypothetical protein
VWLPKSDGSHAEEEPETSTGVVLQGWPRLWPVHPVGSPAAFLPQPYRLRRQGAGVVCAVTTVVTPEEAGNLQA